MKLFIQRVRFLLAGLILCISCDRGNGDLIDPAEGGAVVVSVRVKVPARYSTPTRAVAEGAVSSVDILVFEDTESGYRYASSVSGYSLVSTGEDTYEFRARIVATAEPLKLYLVANTSNIAQALTVGDTEDQVKEAIVREFTSDGFDHTLPMFAEQEFPAGLTTHTEIDVMLVRSVARVDVLNTASAFTLRTVYVYRANDRYQVIPDQMQDDRVTAPSIPAGARRDVHMGPFAVTNNQFAEQLYLPESPAVSPATEQLTATAVVVGGRFGDDTQDTYYRMDFIPDEDPELFGQILRNHRYIFTITSVEGSGWSTPDEAANNNSSQIEAGIKAWDENTLYMVYDASNHFGVSSRVIQVPAPVGEEGSILVDTSLDTYLLYWIDAQGNVDSSIAPITLGESFTSADGLFTVGISADGTRITATANSTGSNEGYLLVRAGRLSVTLTIRQGVQNLIRRTLNVFGSSSQIGSLGDYVLTGSDTGERSKGMVGIMRNTANFGPQGKVPIEGISIAGRSGVNFPPALLTLFDVLYLTYLSSDNTTSVANYLAWLEANDRRVMIVQYDNSSTNINMLNALGISPRYNTTDPYPPFTISPDIPEVIRRGPFGEVDITALIRCQDNTFGEIDLSFALEHGISPILLGKTGGVVLGIDFANRIVYSGDIDLYNNFANSYGESITHDGQVVNNMEKIIANLWAWIANLVLTEE
ncbi:MAG: fimbrial protein [Bacteroides sp.]|nr:fimbrial protein [Bacteroides sp.]